MFREFFQRRRDVRRLAEIRRLAARTGGGVHKRIDENRQLLALLQARAPAFLATYPKVEEWLAAHDDFFTEVAFVAQIPNPEHVRNQQVPGFRYPRPWPGRVGAVRGNDLGEAA